MQILRWITCALGLLVAALVLAGVVVGHADRASAAGGTSVTAGSASFSRIANGNLKWSVSVTVAGDTSTGQACSSSGTTACNVTLEAQMVNGGVVNPLTTANIGHKDPTTVTLAGSTNIAQITAWRISINGVDSSGGYAAYTGSWTSVNDPYSTTSAIVTGGSLYRDGSNQLHVSASGAVSGFSQPDEVCGTGSTCTVNLEGEQADGTVDPLATTTVKYGANYPAAVSFTGSGTYPGLIAWRVSITSMGFNYSTTLYSGPWKPVMDILPMAFRGGTNPSTNVCPCKYDDPIDAYTGSFDESVTDLSLAGAGPTIALSRSYSSLADSVGTPGAFGPGWVTNLEASLVPPSSSSATATATVSQENGSQVKFTANADGSFTAPPGMIASLSYKSSSSTYTFVRRGAQTLTFNSSGQLLTFADLNGNTVTVGRDAYGDVSTLTGSGGRTITLTFSGGAVTGATDSAGRAVTYSYDAAGELSTVTATDGAVTKYTYDSSHRVLKVIRQRGGVTTNVYGSDGRVSSQTDPMNRKSTFTYSGAVTTITRPSGMKIAETYYGGLLAKQVKDVAGSSPRTTTNTYDGGGNLLSSTNPRGNTTTYTYDSSGNVLTKVDALTNKSTFTYDSLNDVLSATDPLGQQTNATYDAAGNQLTSTSPSGRVTSWTYNTNGTIASQTDARSHTTTFGYNPAGLRTSATDPDSRTTRTAYNAAGFVSSTTDAANAVTSYTTDAVGRVLTVTTPGNHTTTSTYDVDGDLTSTKDPRGHASSSTYDLADQRLSETDANTHTTAWTYDADGHIKTVTDANSKVTTKGYNSFGDLISVKDANGNTSTYAYDADSDRTSTTIPSGAVSSATYDAADALSTTTDALGKVTAYGRNADHQVTSVTDALNRATTTTYTPDGQLSVVTQPDGSTLRYGYNANGDSTTFTNADGAATSYAYDAADLRTSKTEPGSMTTGYSYDTAGRLSVTTTPDGHTITQTYDADGNVAGEHSNVTSSTDVGFSYDANGDRTGMTDATGATTYTYDNANQLLSSKNGAGTTVGYSYTATGQLSTITYPGTSRTVTYSYDPTGQMASVKDWNNATTSFAWSPDGDLQTQIDPNGVTESLTSDAAGQTTEIKDVNGTATLADYTYGWDAAGELTSDRSTDPIATNVSDTYTYDKLNQLASVAGAGATGPVTATPGAQLTATADGTTYSYNSASELTSTTPSTGPNSSYTYTGNGDRASQTVAAHGTTTVSATTLGYDPYDDLTSVTPAIGSAITYGADGDGLRQSRAASGSTQQWAWDTASALPLLLDDGTTSYIYGPAPSPISQVSDTSGATTYLHSDLLGSTRVITDSSGTATGSYQYDAYGNVTSHAGSASSAIGYSAAWTDAASGLLYLRARDYDSATGQFVQVDPALDETHEPYAYAENSPTSVSDPTGLCGATPTPKIHCADPGLINDLYLNPQIHAAQNAVFNTFEGFASFLTFGLSEQVGNGLAGNSCVVNHNSGFYQAGEAAGLLVPGDGELGVIGNGLRGAADIEKSADATGVVYRRLDANGGKDYVGQSKSMERFETRQEEHARAHPDADFSYEILGRAEPDEQLDRLEEFYIRQGGGPSTRLHPNGGLSNARHQMNDGRYKSAGGDF